MIGSLGRQATEDKLTIYIKQDNEQPATKELPTLVEQSPVSSRRRSDQGTGSTPVEGSGTASRLLSRYRQQTPLDVPNDLLRTIEEVDRSPKSPVEVSENFDRVAPLPATNAQSTTPLTAAEREKKRYQRTMVRLMLGLNSIQSIKKR